jgi:predicted GTPase
MRGVMERPRRILILGAAGRDFHVSNTYFRDSERYQVVAFTATQIPISKIDATRRS